MQRHLLQRPIRKGIGLLVVASVVAACAVEQSTNTTAPGQALPGSEDVLVLGDWGSGSRAQTRVASAMEDAASGLEPAAILTTGDNFYSNDADDLMAPYSWANEREIPFLIAWGNHDVETQQRIDVVNRNFDDPPRWVLHEWGDVEILVLDSNQVESNTQLEFMVEAMAGSDDPTIVVTHHPPFSCGSHGDSQAIIDHWVSRFDDDVFLVLSGHEHNYQRFESEGVAFVVTGGGGAGLTPLSACPPDHPPRLEGEAVHSFTMLENVDNATIAKTIDASGGIIDEVKLHHP